MNFFEEQETGPEHISMPKSEWQVDEQLPGFEADVSPIVNVTVEPVGQVFLHHENTAIIMHEEGGRFEHMDHVLVIDESQFEEPLYIFPEPEDAGPRTDQEELFEYDEKFDSLISVLQDKGFTSVYIPRRPSEQVFERYHNYIRGKKPIDAITRRIIDNETEG